MKTIKELEAELQFDGFSHNDIEEGKIEALKDVLELIDELVFDTINVTQDYQTGIIRQDELKARIIGE